MWLLKAPFQIPNSKLQYEMENFAITFNMQPYFGGYIVILHVNHEYDSVHKNSGIHTESDKSTSITIYNGKNSISIGISYTWLYFNQILHGFCRNTA